MRRTLSWAVGSLLAAGLTVGPITAASAEVRPASPASPATDASCYYTVLAHDPSANPTVVGQACVIGAEGGTQARHACYYQLRQDNVPALLALEACREASK
jgi:Tfp pilus assembly protein PilW